MKLNDAKRILASYLIGDTVTKGDLEDACDTLNRGERQYLEFLEEELGLPDQVPDLCEVFADRVTEFGEMSDAERREEVPELTEHVKACAECQHMYRAVYLSAFAAGVNWAGIQLRRLAEPIRLLVGWAGELTQSGLGPMEMAPAPTVARDLSLAARIPAKKKWEIRLDEETGLVLQLSIASRKGSQVEVTFELQGKASKEQAAGMRVESCKLGGDLRVPENSGPLSDFEAKPLILESGSWLLRLTSSGGASWEIPLIVDRVDED